jgi:hypothetical protein
MCLASVMLCPEGALGLSPGLNGAKIRAVWDEFQGVTRCEPRHRLEAYATLHPRVVAVGARNSRQEAFRDIARHSGKQCSLA